MTSRPGSIGRLFSLALVAASVFSEEAAAQRANELTAAERTAGWRLLFDGTSLAGWRGLGYDSVPIAHWRVIDGTIVKRANAKVQRQRDGQPLYDIIAPGLTKRLRPVGEWNSARIVLRGNHGEHWLNGAKIVECDLGTARLDSLRQEQVPPDPSIRRAPARTHRAAGPWGRGPLSEHQVPGTQRRIALGAQARLYGD